MDRICSICGDSKLLEDFSVDSKSPSGHRYRCRACDRERSRRWRFDNPVKYKQHCLRTLENYYADRDRKLAISAAYAKKNRVIVSRKAAEKYRTDLKQNIRTRLMSRLAQTITEVKPKNHKWHDLLGYNTNQLMAHLEKHFQPGMTRDNYGEWHIDHRIPIAVFNFSSVDDLDFRRCWALQNLRPLWAVDNIRKQAKLERPFQPSLLIAS